MIKKKTILTFDYELSLGNDSGTIEKCMIEPTYKILEILKRNNSKALFFIDSTFLVVLKQDYYEGYLKVKNQILDILKNGNDVGLHIHPHWIDSYMISKNRWSFKSYDKFRIHNVNEGLKSKIIKDSFEELYEISQEFDISYKINSFRAGGWCVQPFEFIKDDLKNLGIKYDFSVLPDSYINNLPKHFFDYRKYPKNKYFWRFSNDVIKEDKNGYFTEVPTSTYKTNIFQILKLKKDIKDLSISGDGHGIGEATNKIKRIINLIKKIKPFVRYNFSSDYMTLDFFINITNKLNKELLVYVAHPKVFTTESFKILDYICSEFNIISYDKIVDEK